MNGLCHLKITIQYTHRSIIDKFSTHDSAHEGTKSALR